MVLLIGIQSAGTHVTDLYRIRIGSFHDLASVLSAAQQLLHLDLELIVVSTGNGSSGSDEKRK